MRSSASVLLLLWVGFLSGCNGCGSNPIHSFEEPPTSIPPQDNGGGVKLCETHCEEQALIQAPLNWHTLPLKPGEAVALNHAIAGAGGGHIDATVENNTFHFQPDLNAEHLPVDSPRITLGSVQSNQSTKLGLSPEAIQLAHDRMHR